MAQKTYNHKNQLKFTNSHTSRWQSQSMGLILP